MKRYSSRGTPLIGTDPKKIEKSYGRCLNHWVGGLMNIIVQTHYDIQYLIMHLSGYMNAPTEPDLFDLKHVMEYLMENQHEPII